MTIRECYETLGADYDDILRRLGNEDRILRFLGKFPGDGSFADLEASLAEGRCQDAFRAAHTLKGICLNLGLTPLAHSSSRLTEALRGGDCGGAEALFAQVRADYQLTLTAIQALCGG